MRSFLFLACLVGIATADSSFQHDENAKQSQLAFSLPGSHKPAMTPQFKTYVEELRKEYGVHGISIGIVHALGADVEAEYGVWGVRTEDGDPTTSDTLFSIGSCSKAFAASAMGILMDDFAQGKNVTALPHGLQSFTWETKIQDLLPGEWELSDRWASEKANLRDVLSHVSGLPRHDLSYRNTDSTSDIIKRMRLLKPTYELRQTFQYNNQMYVLAAHIISKYSGMTFTSFVEERIFKPVGMESTTYSLEEAFRSGNMSQSFVSNYRRIPHQFSVSTGAEMIAGAGGIASSAKDMNKWLAVLLNNGVHPTSREVIIPRATLAEITGVHSILTEASQSAQTSFIGYGAGWFRYTYRGHEIVAHAGGLPGFTTLTAYLPWDGLGVIVQVNKALAVSLTPILDTIIDTAFDLPSLPSQEKSHDGAPLASLSLNLPGMLAGFSASTAHLAATNSAFPLTAYEGTYSNPGYGAFTLCSSMSTSHYCTEVLELFAPVIAHDDTPGLYAAWTTFWSKHLSLVPRSGHDFGLELKTIYPEGYGLNKTAFVDDDLYSSSPFRATFLVDDEGKEPHVKGFSLPAGFELPETLLGASTHLEKLQLYFEKV